MSGALAVVVGGQYGSEGKGAIAAQLSAKAPGGSEHVAIRVAGPNAGHTVIGPEAVDTSALEARVHREWKLRSIPVAAVSRPDATLVIAAGSEVDLDVLDAELTELDEAGYNASGRLIIDTQATALQPHHILTEQAAELTHRLGSTAKGIGAARADRIWRSAPLVGDVLNDPRLRNRPVRVGDTAAYIRASLAEGGSALVEGTQGYGLGLHAGAYPYCTSSDCRAMDFLAMAGLNPWDEVVADFTVYTVARTRPIRVAGNSGPLRSETSWGELGLPEERTTVTNKVRRVGEWDAELVRRAVIANGGPGPHHRLVITMLDQLFPEVSGVEFPVALSDAAYDWVKARELELGCKIYAVGTSPSTVCVFGDPDLDAFFESRYEVQQ